MPVNFDNEWTGFRARPMAAADAKAVRMLLPHLRDSAITLLAVDSRHGRIVGAGGITKSCRSTPFVGPGVALEVIQPCRRRGIAKFILAQLATAARALFRADGLYAARRVEFEQDEFLGWQWLGFTPLETVEEHILPIEQFELRLGPVVERLRAKGHIPSTAQIVPLYRAQPAAVMQLHLDEMGGDRQELYRKLRGQGHGAFHPRYSRVLLVDDRVQGCILAHRAAKHIAHVDADIVAPSLRGGWANIWLKLEAARRAVRLGIREFTYTSFDHYTDTRSFSEKLGGRIVRKTALMARPLQQNIELPNE